MLLQPLWTSILDHASMLRSPLFPVFFSLGTYLAFCAPFMLLDVLSCRWAWLRRYKLQAGTSVSWVLIRRCLTLTLYNHLLYIFPLSVLHWYLRPVHLPPQAPPLAQLLAQVLVCLLLFDFMSFIWHLLHHRVPWLYHNFHKVHHTFTSPSSLTTEFSSAYETLSLVVFASVPPAVLGVHPLSELVFFTLNMYLSVEDHSGWDLPWATHRLFPLSLYGGAPHHLLHHRRAKGNYAPYFTHWDRLAGTLCTLHPRPRPGLGNRTRTPVPSIRTGNQDPWPVRRNPPHHLHHEDLLAGTLYSGPGTMEPDHEQIQRFRSN